VHDAIDDERIVLDELLCRFAVCENPIAPVLSENGPTINSTPRA
jgi:hypothetical protein